jgi:hypothetical protein
LSGVGGYREGADDLALDRTARRYPAGGKPPAQ